MINSRRQGASKVSKSEKRLKARLVPESRREADLRADTLETPLHDAVSVDEYDNVDLLLRHGADPYLEDKRRTPAFHRAAANGLVRCLKVFLEHYPNLVYVTRSRCGRTALHDAVAKGQHESIICLVRNGADVAAADNTDVDSAQYENPEGQTAIHKAAIRGDVAALKILLEPKKGLNARCAPNRSTALHLAAHRLHQGCIEALLEAGADGKIRDGTKRLYTEVLEESRNAINDVPINCRETLLHIAVSKNSLLDVESLLKSGARTDIMDHAGETAIHRAAKKGDLKILTLLLKHAGRGDVDIQGHLRRSSGEAKLGPTALHLAGGAGHADCVTAILRKGADPTLKDGDGRTAYERAKFRRQKECRRVLERLEMVDLRQQGRCMKCLEGLKIIELIKVGAVLCKSYTPVPKHAPNTN